MQALCTLLTRADWTAKERDLAISTVLRLVGMKAAGPAKRQGNKPQSGNQTLRGTAPRKA